MICDVIPGDFGSFCYFCIIGVSENTFFKFLRSVSWKFTIIERNGLDYAHDFMI
jgi:hypothetical protein